MELKKGDIVAVVAEVVAERDGKIIISIPGATVSEDLIIAPRKPIKILDRAPSPGDEVLYKGDMRCIFRRNETQSVVSLVRDGMPHDDPSSYLFANIRDIRRVDQSGTVKFVSVEKPVPNSETGREVMDRLTATDEDTSVLAAAEQAPIEKSFEVDDQAFTRPQADVVTEDRTDDTRPRNEALQEDTLPDEVVQASPEGHTLDNEEAPAPEAERPDSDSDSDSDKITIEMPEGFAPRYPAPVDTLVPAPVPEAPVSTRSEPEDQESADSEVISDEAEEDAITTSDEAVEETQSKDDAQEPDPTDSVTDESVVHDGDGEASAHDEIEEPAQPEMTEEERQQRELRLQKLRDQTLPQLNGNGDAQPTADKGNDIFDDIDDLDN